MASFFESVVTNLERRVTRFPANELRNQYVCLQNVSKTFEASFQQDVPSIQKCKQKHCVTYKDYWQMDPCKLDSYRCDDDISRDNFKLLFGSWVAVTSYIDDEEGRGVDVGRLEMRDSSNATVFKGIMSGNINVETHHIPVGGQSDCFAKGHREGELRGVVHIEKLKQPAILLVQYAMNIENNRDRTKGKAAGTLEGSIITECDKAE